MTSVLQGCRVLDLGIITAGAATGAMLADLGAEVIKIESPSYRDPFRVWTASAGADERCTPFSVTNRNKEGISIDLKTDAGRKVFFDLLDQSDIVLENFRRGVLTQLGIDYPVLAARRPEIILASISSQGESGPSANYVSFGTTLEAMGGMAWQTGYDEASGPVATGRSFNYPDQVVALFATGMVLAAWRQRQRAGRGTHLELSQRELTSFLVGEHFAAADEPQARIGNADPAFAMQGCVPCRDGWLAVTVRFDQQDCVAALAGLPAFDPAQFQAWCARQQVEACVNALAQQSVAAAPVLNGRQAGALRGTLWQDAIVDFDETVPVKGFPFAYGSAPFVIQRDAPEVGRDTAEVLQRVAGYAPEDIARLMAAGAIEGRPETHRFNAIDPA